MKLVSKKILITGGTSGIGKEMLRELSNENELIVLGRNQARLANLMKEFPGIEVYQLDLSKLDDVITVADKIVKSFPEIDILINNAAVQYTPRFTSQDFCIETVTKEITCNFSAICYLIYCLLPSLTKESKSIILNINSGLALAPKTSSAVYCASKAALNTFSMSLGYQLEETNIKVMQAFLPLVDTPMTAGRGKGKVSAQYAAKKIIKGLRQERENNYIGKVGLLVVLLRAFPSLAKRIMKGW